VFFFLLTELLRTYVTSVFFNENLGEIDSKIAYLIGGVKIALGSMS
jgi:hypothetical protein